MRPCVEELVPDALGEPEVGGVVAVQVADLAPADLERELAAAAGARRDARPRRDLLGDPLACRCSSSFFLLVGSCRTGYKFK